MLFAILSAYAHGVLRDPCQNAENASEIAQLRLDDVVLDSPRPHLSLRAPTTKGKWARRVPLWWDSGTLADVAALLATRRGQGARGGDRFVSSVQAHRLARHFALPNKWRWSHARSHSSLARRLRYLLMPWPSPG
jgi:hypothetical protein